MQLNVIGTKRFEFSKKTEMGSASNLMEKEVS
jgi:hypothetical protein